MKTNQQLAGCFEGLGSVIYLISRLIFDGALIFAGCRCYWCWNSWGAFVEESPRCTAKKYGWLHMLHTGIFIGIAKSNRKLNLLPWPTIHKWPHLGDSSRFAECLTYFYYAPMTWLEAFLDDTCEIFVFMTKNSSLSPWPRTARATTANSGCALLYEYTEFNCSRCFVGEGTCI